MKVIDPQSALLTTAELHHFLNNNQARKADIKVGGYESVNVDNYNLVRKDLETYLQTTTPYVNRQPIPERWMNDLIQKLKQYELTKTEVFALINLGVGTNEPISDEIEETAENGNESNGGDTQMKTGEDTTGPPSQEVDESGLDLMLFNLVVEESDERFAGDEGERKISEILRVLKETFPKDESKKHMNGDQHQEALQQPAVPH